MPERIVMAIMGWSSASMAQRYQHVTEPMLNDVGRKIGAALWGDVGSDPEERDEDAA
ncbi:site-specific integrase [Kitasatospora aureofaciens]|uniref:site-specific integrase n=1 Tax=Kitasatospora aureofaciens TaxID=1894 RepID=UPI000AF7567B